MIQGILLTLPRVDVPVETVLPASVGEDVRRYRAALVPARPE